MPAANPFHLFTQKFEKLGVRYMVTGSVASMLYGDPRLTNDVDIVLDIKPEDARRLSDLFPDAEFYFPPGQVIQVEIARRHRGHFNIIHHVSGFKADIYLAGTDTFHEWGLARANAIVVEAERIILAPPEYVIVRKLEFFQEGGSVKHLEDIRTMLSASAELIDQNEIDRIVGERGLSTLWQQVQQPR
ncbi:MAG: hypothetical protein SGI88_19565 [Candidatus Hydrogenedentes bacterium]|nr:hypothetical protein [Candidatus Hydrogenedentota bacterium]